MIEISPDMVFSVLTRDYPEILRSIKNDLNSLTSQNPLKDLSLIPGIIDDILVLKDIDLTGFNWNQSRGYKVKGLNYKQELETYLFCQLREIIVAVLINLYDPVKLNGLSNRKTKIGVMQAISDYTGCNRVPLYQNASDAIAHYKIYIEFKNEINYLTEKIKEKFD